MSDALDRAEVLIDQGRFEMAREHLLRELGEDPDDGLVHAMIALCFIGEENLPAAQMHAERGVALDPREAHAHLALGLVLSARNDLQGALRAAEECVRLDPGDESGHELMADVLVQMERWPEALTAAERALEAAPGNVAAANDRAIALRMLGREDDQVDALRAALAIEPENATTHANLGYALALRGENEAALTHLREALRIEPNDEFAREGVIKALRHVFPPLLWGMRYRLWLSRGSRGRRFLVGLVVGLALWMLAFPPGGLLPESFPNMTVFWGIVGLVFFASVAPFVFDFLLQFHPLGRLAMLRRTRTTALLVTASAALGLVGTSAYLWPESPYAGWSFWMGTLFLALSFPLAVTSWVSRGWPLKAMGIAAACAMMLLVLCGVVAIVGETHVFFGLWTACVYTCAGCALLGLFLRNVKPLR